MENSERNWEKWGVIIAIIFGLLGLYGVTVSCTSCNKITCGSTVIQFNTPESSDTTNPSNFGSTDKQTESEVSEVSPVPLPVSNVETSSTGGKNEKYNRTYEGENTIDGDLNTCWLTYNQNHAENEWIRYNFNGEKTVYGIKLINGNMWDGKVNGRTEIADAYNRNSRLKTFIVSFSDGTSETFTAADVKEKSFDQNVFYFSKPVVTDYVKITVKSTYQSSDYGKNVTITEFQAFGID